MARMKGGRVMQQVGGMYVSFFRGTPMLVTILLVYYALQVFHLNVTPVFAVIIALGMSSTAYVAEIYRGSVNSIPPGQIEAAEMVGMTTAAIWMEILFPQAFRLSIPPLVSETILTVKSSSLVSLVGVTELTSTSQSIASSNFHPLELYVTAGAIYILINALLYCVGIWMEKRMVPGGKYA